MNCTHACPCHRLGPLSAAALLLLSLAVTGCQDIGFVANAVAGGDETVDVKAQYLGLQNKTTAVLVTMDDHVLLQFRDADVRLCRSISQQIKTNVPGATVLAPAEVAKFQHEHPRLAAVPYGQLLKELKVDRLVLVDVFEYRTHDAGNPNQWQGVCSAGVSVAAADNADPDDLVFSTQAHMEYPKDAEIGMLNTDNASIEAALQMGFALQVSWLFYDHKEPAPKMTRRAAYSLGLLLLAVAALSGCGTMARLFQGDSVDPVFKPEDRPTLIITEQDQTPDGPVLGDPSLTGVVTTNIMFHLKDQGAITQFIPPEKVAEVQKQYGDKFKDLPDTVLARKVGAEQVLRVRIRSASIAADPGVLRPEAVVFVWLCDAKTNQVIFPEPGTGNEAVAPEAQSGPHVLTVKLAYESSADKKTEPTARLARALAERIGRDVARIFFSYVPDSPGTP